MQKLDMNSAEFKEEMEKTKKFTDKVVGEIWLGLHPDQRDC